MFGMQKIAQEITLFRQLQRFWSSYIVIYYQTHRELISLKSLLLNDFINNKYRPFFRLIKNFTDINASYSNCSYNNP